jgi:type II secretory pathway predicted ATPase ExeA
MSDMTLVSAAADLSLPDPTDAAACSAWLQARYMTSERDTDFQEALRDMLETDAQGNLTAKPLRVGLPQDTRGLMVLGPSGSGKTSLVTRNLRKEAKLGLTMGEGPGAVLYHLVSAEATLKSVAIGIAKATGYTQVKESIKTVDAWDLALHRLSAKKISILWIDEPHHLLAPGPGRDAKMVLRRLKSLLQGPKAVALILTAVPELHQMVVQDSETARRFGYLHLRPVSNEAGASELNRYLAKCCERIGMGKVEDANFIDRLLMANRRNLGRSIEMTLRAIRRAHRRPERQLSLADFRACMELNEGSSGIGPFDDDQWELLKPALEKLGWLP